MSNKHTIKIILFLFIFSHQFANASENIFQQLPSNEKEYVEKLLNVFDQKRKLQIELDSIKTELKNEKEKNKKLQERLEQEIDNNLVLLNTMEETKKENKQLRKENKQLKEEKEELENDEKTKLEENEKDVDECNKALKNLDELFGDIFKSLRK